MSNVDIQNAIPTDFILRRPTSTSKSILRKNLMEVLPVEQTSFIPGQNQIIRFQVASNSDILSGPESYCRFDFTQTVDNHDNLAALDVGGINSLFRVIEIRALGSGILLQRYDQYHRWNAIQSLLKDSPEDIECKGQSSGDSMGIGEYNAGREESRVLSGVGFAIDTSGIVTASGGLALRELAVGDMVTISGRAQAYNTAAGGSEVADIFAAQEYTGTVTAIASNTAFTLSPPPVTPMTASGAGAARVYKKKSIQAARSRACSGETMTLTFKPRLSLLTHNIPLFLMKGGIEISFELDSAHRSLQLISNANLSVGNQGVSPAYEITRPRFMAMMVTPHSDIVDEYVKEWRSPTGLVYSIPSVRYRRGPGVAGEQNTSLHVNPGVRSARRMYMAIQESSLAEAASTSVVGNLYAGISTFLRDLVTSFQVKIGSHEYPNRAVACDADSYEMKEQLKQVCGNYGAMRLQPQDWASADDGALGLSTAHAATITAVNHDAKHFIFGVDLSRDDGPNGELTGADLSVVPMDVELERSAARDSTNYAGRPIYHIFIEHDSFLKISSEQTSVIN